MISLEQIQKLESRVHAAVDRIKHLSDENAALTERLESYERRIGELQSLVTAFKSDQEQIEAGIVATLARLDELEDSVAASGEESAAPATPPKARKDEAVAVKQPPVEEIAVQAEPETAEGEPIQADGPEDAEEEESEDESPELDIF